MLEKLRHLALHTFLRGGGGLSMAFAGFAGAACDLRVPRGRQQPGRLSKRFAAVIAQEAFHGFHYRQVTSRTRQAFRTAAPANQAILSGDVVQELFHQGGFPQSGLRSDAYHVATPLLHSGVSPEKLFLFALAIHKVARAGPSEYVIHSFISWFEFSFGGSGKLRSTRIS